MKALGILYVGLIGCLLLGTFGAAQDAQQEDAGDFININVDDNKPDYTTGIVVGEEYYLDKLFKDGTRMYGVIRLPRRPERIAVYLEGKRLPDRSWVCRGKKLTVYVDNDDQDDVIVDYYTRLP